MFEEDEVDESMEEAKVGDGHYVALANSTKALRKLLRGADSPSKDERTYKDKLTPDELDALQKAIGALGKLSSDEVNDIWRESKGLLLLVQKKNGAVMNLLNSVLRQQIVLQQKRSLLCSRSMTVS